MTDQRLRILVVSSHLKSMGGAEKNVLDLSRGLQQHAHIEVAGLQCGDVLEQIRAQGVPVHDLDLRSPFSPKAFFRALWLRRKLRKERFDVVVTYHHDADIWAGVTAWLSGVPVVSSRRDMGYALSGAHILLYRLLNRLFSRIIVVSQPVRDEIVRRQWAPRDRIVVINNGLEIRPEDRDAREVRQELGLHPSRPIIGTVANIRPIKGQEFFVEAAAEVARQTDDAQFVVVGSTDSDYYEKIRKMILELGLEDRFFCVGKRADIHRLLSAFNIFVLPSRQEGFSNALVEAMSVGVVPVASAVGGNPEAIDHGKNGFLFQVGDTRAFARHLMTLLGDKELRERMGAAAAGTVKARFSFDGMVSSVLAVLTDAARRARP